MENCLTTINRNDIYIHKKKNNMNNMIDESSNITIKKSKSSTSENNYEIKTFGYNKKKNNNYHNEDKENIIMNPIKQNDKNKRKSDDKNTFQKLIDSKKRKKEIEEKKDDNNKIYEYDTIEEESINKYNNNKIENEENSEIENEIELKTKTCKKLENNPTLAEKLKNIFQVRNKIETSGQKNFKKIREMKYDSEESLSSEEIRTKKSFNDYDDEESDEKTNLNLKEDEKELSEDINEITKEKNEEEEYKNNLTDKNEKMSLKEKLLLMMEIKKKKDEEKKKKIEENENSFEENEENEDSFDKEKNEVKLINNNNLTEEEIEEEKEKEENEIEEKEFEERNNEEIDNKKNEFSIKQNISGLRNIIDMLKAKKLEEEKIKEESNKSIIEESENEEEKKREEEERKIREEKRKERKRKEEERKRKKEEEERKKIEEENKKIDEEKKRKEKEKSRKIELEQKEKKRKEEEEKIKKEIEEEEKRKRIEEERIKKQIEEERKRKIDEEEKRKKQIEEKTKRKKIEEEKRKKEIEEEIKRKKLEEEKRKKEIEKEERIFYNKEYNNNKMVNKNEKQYNNGNENENHKRNNSFSKHNKTEIKFEETPKLIDRSFDGSNTTYQKPFQKNKINPQINIGKSKTNLIYTKKGMRGRSIEKINENTNSNYTMSNINNNNNSNCRMFQNISNNNNYINSNFENNNLTNTTNITNISNQKTLDYSYTNNPNLNGSFQDINYKKPINQIYCKSPNRYQKQNQNLFDNRYYGSSKNIFGYNNDNDFYDNGFNTLSTGINSMSNIHHFSNINSMNNSLSYNNFNNYSNNNNINYSQVSLSINLEDLMILEEKLIEIINALNINKVVHNECFEWWNFYYNCSLFTTIEKAFKREDSGIIISSIKYELFTLMLCYDISFNNNLLNKVFIMIKALLNLNHKNLLIICEYILSKISNESLGNIWVYKLNDLINSSKNSTEEDYISFNGHTLSLIEKIKYNTNSISNDIRIILKNYQFNPKTEKILSLYRLINEKNYDEINKFFRENIIRVENPNASVLASYVLKENSNFYTVAPPYLKTKNLKKYTLVLDLDETIIHFKVNPNNDSEGVLRVRPGIFEFLETLGKYYEIIVFTAATQDYADLLIDAIEENKIYFDYRLYRQHAVIIDNDFVKDLTRLGRPIDKMIIVDNMPQNFRLQKENGINIRAFWGEDPYDTALIDLMPILVNIANDGGDVRFGLAKYRNDILKKVTSNISKHDD